MRVILWLLRLAAAVLVVGAAVPAVLALGGFAVPLLDLFNHLQLLLVIGTLGGLALALVLRMRRRWLVLALAGFIASAWTFGPEWVSGLAPRPPLANPTLKVMTHNIFGLNYDIERIDAAIRAEDPDIVALQEFFPEQAGLTQLLKGRYPYFVQCRGGKRANLGLFSKLPFEATMRPEDCPPNARGEQRTAHITGRFTLADGTVFSLMTTHMDWPYPVERQRDQLDAAAEAINATAGPLLVVGDFNSTPWSYAMKRFEAATGLVRETRALLTYPTLFTVPASAARLGFLPLEPSTCTRDCFTRLLRLTPFLPLDQVFQRGISVGELHTGSETGSDHLPVVFTFAVNP